MSMIIYNVKYIGLNIGVAKMKSARDPNVDYKKLVREGYDQCGEDYSKQRKERANSELKLLLKMLNSGANVLDIGCGEVFLYVGKLPVNVKSRG